MSEKFLQNYDVIWVSFMTSFFNTVNQPLNEATQAKVPGLGWCRVCGSIGTPGLGLGPGGWGTLTLRCLASLCQKTFFHLNVFLRTGKSNKTPRYFLPPQSQPYACQSSVLPSSVWFSYFFLKHLHGLGVRLGRAFWGPGGLCCFLVGVCCCPSPFPLPISAPGLSIPQPTSPSRSHLQPQNVFVSLSVSFVVGFILV